MSLPGWRVVNVSLLGLQREVIYAGRLERFGRPTTFGNAFGLMGLPRNEAIRRHAEWLDRQVEIDPDFRMAVMSLAGRVLGCHCKPSSCHGETIALCADRLFLDSGLGRALCVAPAGEAGRVASSVEELESGLIACRGREQGRIYLLASDCGEVSADCVWQGRAEDLLDRPEEMAGLLAGLDAARPGMGPM